MTTKQSSIDKTSGIDKDKKVSANQTPTMVRSTKGERIYHDQTDDLMLWWPNWCPDWSRWPNREPNVSGDQIEMSKLKLGHHFGRDQNIWLSIRFSK